MALTPEKIAELDKLTGLTGNVSAGSSSGKSRADEIRALAGVKAPVEKGIIPDIFDKSVESIKKRGEGVYGAITGTSEKSQGENAVVRGFQATGEVFGGLTDVGTNILTSLAGKLIPEGVKKNISEQAQKSKESPLVKAVTETGSKAYEELGLRLNEFAQEHPEAAKRLESLLKTTEAGGEIAGGILTAEGMRQTAVKSAKIPSKIDKAIDNTNAKISKVGTPNETKVFDKTIEETQKILNPGNKYTPTEVEKLRARGEVKVTGSGPFKKEVASPKPGQQNETLAELVKEGKISARKLPSENVSAIKQEARRVDLDIDEVVNRPELNKPFNKNIINKVFDKVEDSAKKDLVFVPDTTEAKAYKAVIEVAREEIAKNPFNNAGLRKSIKAFNARMEKILGKNIYGEGSESVANARIQGAKDMRGALNDFLADNLESPVVSQKGLYTTKGVSRVLPSKSQFESGRIQGGGLYKKMLQKEAQLLNSADEIGYRSRGTLNKTQLKQLLDSNPKLKYALEIVGGGLVAKELLD